VLILCRYLEVNYTLGNVGGGQLSANMMLEPPGSPISHDRIWREARVCLVRIWGSEYPAAEILDDLENYRGLDLLQECQKLKMTTWMLGTSATADAIPEHEKECLWRSMEILGKVRLTHTELLEQWLICVRISTTYWSLPEQYQTPVAVGSSGQCTTLHLITTQ
jgi:hypothetical protein